MSRIQSIGARTGILVVSLIGMLVLQGLVLALDHALLYVFYFDGRKLLIDLLRVVFAVIVLVPWHAALVLWWTRWRLAEPIKRETHVSVRQEAL